MIKFQPNTARQVERSFSTGKKGGFFPRAENTEKELGGKGAVRAMNGHTVNSASKVVSELQKKETGNQETKRLEKLILETYA